MSTFAGRHSCDSPEWYTPIPIVDAARRVMGRIDLDPASHPEANAHIRARRIYTEDDNGLILPWRGRIVNNPPGGLVADFWAKLLYEFAHGRTREAIWIGYSLEQLQSLQRCPGIGRFPFDFPMCIPRDRLAFIENRAKRRARFRELRALGKVPTKRSQPSHGNYVTYLGANRAAFRREFSQFGKVL